MNTQRLLALAGTSLLILGLAGGLARAADDSGASAGSRAERLAQAREKLDARFAKADADHDGKLTLAEAQAGMPRVAKAFDQIDSQGKGYVTKDELAAFLRERAAERRAAKQPAQ